MDKIKKIISSLEKSIFEASMAILVGLIVAFVCVCGNPILQTLFVLYILLSIIVKSLGDD